MTGVIELTDAVVQEAADGSEVARDRILAALRPRARLTVTARLSPTLVQVPAVDDLTEQSLAALAAGLTRLEDRTVTGLRAFLSGIVAHKVADFVRTNGRAGTDCPAVRSLDSTVVDLSQVGPLWQFLSASGVSPLTAVDQAERIRTVMEEFGRLDEPHREILTLAFFDQLPVGQIADRLAMSPWAASRLLIRAVQTLRRNVVRSSVWGPACDRAD